MTQKTVPSWPGQAHMADTPGPAEAPSVLWRRVSGLSDYLPMVSAMEAEVQRIRAGGREQVWLVEHPPLYTAGTSAEDGDLLDSRGLPVHRTGRGGRYTWHGPGQRVAYVMLDLKRRGSDVRAFVCDLEGWIIAALAAFGLQAERRTGRIGLWISGPDGRDAKIAAIGVRVRHWISYHGVAINLCPDLRHFEGIIPCGIRQHGVTSMAAEGVKADMDSLDRILKQTFEARFRRTTEAWTPS